MPAPANVLLLCLALLVPALGHGGAAPSVELELIAIDPADRTALPLFAPLYGRIAYRSETPVRLTLRPYRDGQPVLQGVSYSSSPRHPGRDGEGIAWFTFSEAQQIDEIRALARDDRGDVLASTSLRKSLSWRAGEREVQTAAWVETLQQRRADLADVQHSGDSGAGGWALVLVELVFLLVPLSVVLQIVALMVLDGWRGGLARLSALGMGGLWLFVIATGLAGSNLSPIWLVFLSPLFVLLLGALLVQHWLARRRAAGH